MFSLTDFRYVVIDNFYANIDSVRDFALSMEFSITGDFPGIRTESMVGVNGQVKNVINFLFEEKVDEEFWDYGYTGSFQSTQGKDTTWVHCERYNCLNAVLFLSKNPPIKSGVGFFHDSFFNSRSISELTEEQRDVINNTENTSDKWVVDTFIPGLYNRLVIFYSKLWHTGMGFFGDTLENSRLTQCFFIRLNSGEG